MYLVYLDLKDFLLLFNIMLMLKHLLLLVAHWLVARYTVSSLTFHKNHFVFLAKNFGTFIDYHCSKELTML